MDKTSLGNRMKYPEHEYINFDPFEGDFVNPGEIRCNKIKIITTRKTHECHLSLLHNKPHQIKQGEKARFEKAIMDGKWCNWYCCIDCIEKDLRELGILPPNEPKCFDCENGAELDECTESKNSHGHHCECSWTQDKCCWCGKEFGEELD